MSMQVNVCLNKEQIGTLFVQVGAPEGGFRGGGRGSQGGPAQKSYKVNNCFSWRLLLVPLFF